jgi:Ca2+/H+ antiporter
MNLLLKEIRHNPMLWLLVFVPVVFAAAKLKPEAHTLLFVLSVLAIVPLAGLLSHATESVAAKTGDAAGGLLNATLGNLTELVIALTALRAGEYMLVKASIAGAIVTNTLFMLGASFLLGGLKHHVQEFNRVNARVQSGLLFLATVALLVPSTVATADSAAGGTFARELSVGLAVLLIVTYGLGLLFSLVERHAVVTDPEILSLRVDESLYFPNARFIEELVNDAVAANPAIRHVILECPAVNTIDVSALESLEAINHRLADGGVTLHLSEVKGPVMDQLKRSRFLQELSGKVHLSQFEALASIKPDLAKRTRAAPRAVAGGAAGVEAGPPSQPT